MVIIRDHYKVRMNTTAILPVASFTKLTVLFHVACPAEIGRSVLMILFISSGFHSVLVHLWWFVYTRNVFS